MKDPRIAGALYDFCANLTVGESITLGRAHDAPAVIDRLTSWADERGLDLEAADVMNWHRESADGKARLLKAIRAMKAGIKEGTVTYASALLALWDLADEIDESEAGE